MDKIKKILLLLVLCISFISNAQLLKYSTFYISGDISSPLTEENHYMMDRTTGQLTDITVVNPYNYKLNIGLRKIARFDYENKAKNFYDGSENSISSYASIGAVTGSEYLLSCELSRDRGKEFTNHEYWYRYVGNYWMVRGEYTDNQEIHLKHFGADVRSKISFKGFDLSAGVKHRTHPVYGLNPFTENYDLETDPWWNVAYDLGYEDEYYFVDGDQNGIDDWYDYYNWNWFDPDGTQVAITDQEFMKYEFGKAVDQYNKQQLDSLGLQQEVSFVMGLSYYYYNPKFWIHVWGDVLPWHKGLTDYSYASMDIENKTEIDFNIGGVIGTKITKRIGVFIEGRFQRYWDINNYEIKTGVNYTIF
tara:strand:+ start:122 stop:1207 length:1086 start_codon:yes stop_codon:yes gene_type:complete